MSGKRRNPQDLATNHVPIVVDLRPGAALVRNNIQYLQEACLGIRDHIQCLQGTEILTECQCPWNTPLLPVKKSGRNDYRPSRASVTSPVQWSPSIQWSPRSYLLLRLLPSHTGWFTARPVLSYILLALALASLPASPSLPLKGKTHLLGGRHS